MKRPWSPELGWAPHHGGPPRSHKRGPFLRGHRHNPMALTASIDSQQRRSRCVSGGEGRVLVHSARSLPSVRSQAATKSCPRPTAPLGPFPSASPRLSPLPSCRRVPLTASEAEASASLLSTSQQLREELATCNPRTGKLGSGAEPRRSEVTQRTAAAPGFSRGLGTPVPCSFPASGHSVIREPDQVQELPGAGVCAGCRVRNRESGRGSTQGTLLRWARGTRVSQRSDVSSSGQADS